MRLFRATGSLTRRVALVGAVWVTLGLAFTGWFVMGFAGRHIVAAADARLTAHMHALIAAVAVGPDGQLRLERPMTDPEFERPLSGTYWQLTGASGALRSRSLWDASLWPGTGTGIAEVNAANVAGPRGEPLRLLQQRVEVQGSPGPILVQVTGPREQTERDLARLRYGLAAVFGLLGLGLVGGLVGQLVWAMAPLRRLRDALAGVRAGERDRIGLDAPSEVAPLVEEVDALIAQNRETVDRARAHVGNLAHALKTPAAVLGNALETVSGPGAETARAQLRELDHILRHHLARARASALTAQSAGGGGAPARAAAEEVAQALRQLQRGPSALAIAVEGDAALRVRADRQDLVEMLGNLMENATKWARGTVRVTVRRDGDRAVFLVEDDGPGLQDGAAAEAANRGVRLDEAVPGAGLGLAIVRDLAGLHDGSLTLGASAALGGLSARLDLKAVPAR